MCEKINCPSLVWAFNDPVNEIIEVSLISDFRLELMTCLSTLSTGRLVSLPSNTDPHHLPAFVAMAKPPGGPAALYRLGYRPSWESPSLHGEKYEVKFFLPNGDSTTFLTGPNGGFSVYALWLEMRILCAQSEEIRSVNDKSASPCSSSKDSSDFKTDTSKLFAQLFSGMS